MEPKYAELLNKPNLKVQQAADLLGVNHKTVREMVEQGKLPHYRLGRTLRIPTSAVREMLCL